MSDLIRKKDALAVIEKNNYRLAGSGLTYDFMIEQMKNVPTIYSEPVQMGTWVQISPARIYECSVCGGNVMTGDIDVYKWCHQCGARMDGE